MNKKLILALLSCVNAMQAMNKTTMYKHAQYARAIAATERVRIPCRPYVPKRNFLSPIVFVHEGTQAIIERWGKYNRTMKAGLNFKIPIMEDVRRTDWGTTRVDVRERVGLMPHIKVITADNVVMDIAGLYVSEVENSQQAVYSIENLPDAINKLAQTTLRNLIGGLHLDQTLTSRNQINERLCAELGQAASKWGVKITRVELQEINPPVDIKAAMEREMTAERNRRAVILEADGKKKAAILEAEGSSAAIQLEAEGKAAARKKLAEAEATSITLIQDAMNKGTDSGNYLITMRYMETLPLMTKGEKGKTVVVPYDASSLASMTVMLKNMWKSKEIQK